MGNFLHNAADHTYTVRKKVCSRCKSEKTLDEFVIDNGKHDGRSCYCIFCHREYQREQRAEFKKKYGESQIQWEYKDRPNVYKLRSYKGYDKRKGLHKEAGEYFNSYEIDDFLEKAKCFYCGTRGNLGLDRIDNSKGHTKDNVVACCTCCNLTRGDRFTSDEMKIIGKAIKEILSKRSVNSLPEVNDGE